MPELIAGTADEFLRIASDLAADFDRLAQMRASLRRRMQTSPLMDAVGVTREVEDAYRTMWKQWCGA